MRQQEEKMRAKYGDLKPKKPLIHKDVKYFDSADWALQHQKGHEGPQKGEEDVEKLPSKLPTVMVLLLLLLLLTIMVIAITMPTGGAKVNCA